MMRRKIKKWFNILRREIAYLDKYRRGLTCLGDRAGLKLFSHIYNELQV